MSEDLKDCWLDRVGLLLLLFATALSAVAVAGLAYRVFDCSLLCSVVVGLIWFAWLLL
jgi:hypothetical protein